MTIEDVTVKRCSKCGYIDNPPYIPEACHEVFKLGVCPNCEAHISTKQSGNQTIHTYSINGKVIHTMAISNYTR